MEWGPLKMKLKQLVKGNKELTIKGNKEVIITGITANSKMVSPGNLFIAKKGTATDGNMFILEAIRGGAAAVVSDMYAIFLKSSARTLKRSKAI
jgi:UDP-N-acetylmuramoyl-L-alanyl-D-glutamate--2,6-diaminopimelate ligase